MYSSVRSTSRSSTGRPRPSRRSSITLSRVIDSRMLAVTGGVMATPLRMMKRQEPEDSETLPALLRKMGAS
jgi:hypothetical protein